MNRELRPEVMERIKINKRAIIKRKARPCMDCTLTWHPAVMTLDHVDRGTKLISPNGRRLNPSDMITFPTDEFDKMLQECDVVCGNCHGIREMKRDGYDQFPQWKKYTDKISTGALLHQ